MNTFPDFPLAPAKEKKGGEKKKRKNVWKEREYICKFNFPREKRAFQSNFDMFLSSLCNL